ncbi:MAG: hypothetical protein KatS3mg077_0005 [Candidatus Binatia bacterium]|nr:MAG: hypothetical protein KatS3mg077_0005 [Candidatus Binatia bacterium]
MKNLDLACAELGRELAELKAGNKPIEEKVFTNALSVLEEQGPYACFLYLQAREGEAGEEITKRSAQFLEKVLNLNTGGKKPLEAIEAVAGDVDDLLLARDLLRQAFVYARYYVKARPNG